MRKPPRELVDAICVSLAMDDGWSFSNYEIWHKEKKIKIWIANELYGLDVSVNGNKFGGVVAFGFLSRWRWRIGLAAQRHIERRLSNAVREGAFE